MQPQALQLDPTAGPALPGALATRGDAKPVVVVVVVVVGLVLLLVVVVVGLPR